MDSALFNMVEQQIRPWNVFSAEILRSLQNIKREHFVADEYRQLAYSDIQLPIGDGQYMLEPRLEARILQVLNIKPQDMVFEIGTGSGFFTALLCNLAKSVLSVDINDDFINSARSRLEKYLFANFILKTADGLANDFKIPARYDVIILTGSTPIIPKQLVEVLNPEGRIFGFIHNKHFDQAVILEKADNGALKEREVLETSVPPLLYHDHGEEREKFVF